MPSVRASCCPLPLATPSGERVNHQSSVTLLCLNYKLGLFGIIKQICHASGGNMMECLPSGGWCSLGLRPRGKPSSLGETFHHVTPTGMAYLYNVLGPPAGRSGKEGVAVHKAWVIEKNPHQEQLICAQEKRSCSLQIQMNQVVFLPDEISFASEILSNVIWGRISGFQICAKKLGEHLDFIPTF